MNLIYIDESGNTGLNFKDKQQPIFLLSAIVIHDSKWFNLESDFNKILNCHWPNHKGNIEIHASDIVSRKNAFKDFNFAETIEIRDKFLNMFLVHNIPLIYLSIHKGKYEVFCENEYGPGIKIDPYIMALPYVCIAVDQILKEKNKDELGMFIFDDQKEYFVKAEQSIKTLRLDPNSILKTTNIIEKGFFVDSKKSFAIQLADVAAFYARKFEENKLGLRVSEFHKQTFNIITKISINAKRLHSEDILDWVKKNNLK